MKKRIGVEGFRTIEGWFRHEALRLREIDHLSTALSGFSKKINRKNLESLDSGSMFLLSCHSIVWLVASIDLQ
jgi:hypothetical protein